MQNIENESVQPSNTELVELDRFLSNDDDINYSNDYITIDANDGGVFIQNTTAAEVTLVTPSGNLIINIGFIIILKHIISMKNNVFFNEN